MIDKQTIIAALPPDLDEWVKVSEDQSVPDIIDEIVNSHYGNEAFYNKIALFFNAPTAQEICDNIYDFERENIEYREETKDVQTVRVPQGILNSGFGDCKHFASFAGGVLSGISRLTGKKIDWCYRFVSYQLLKKEPYHVFVVVFDRGREIWIDATPGTDGKQPVWIVDQKISGAGNQNMPLYTQIAGAGDIDELSGDVVINEVETVPAEIAAPITYLQSLGILSPIGTFNEARYRFLNSVYPPESRALLHSAIEALQSSAGSTVGNWFDDVFKGVQHFAAGLGMQVPRASFLILVRMNAFGYANKLSKALQYTDTREKLEDLWWRVGGQPDVLRSTIAEGAAKPPATTVQGDNTAALQELALAGGTYRDANGILHDINTGAAIIGGVGCSQVSGVSIGIVPVVAAAIIASATTIISIIIPVITKLLDKHSTTQPGLPIDPATGLPVGYSGNSISSFVQNNPIIVAALAAALGWYVYENY